MLRVILCLSRTDAQYVYAPAISMAWDTVWVCAAVSIVKTLKFGTPEIITIIVLQLEQLDFTVQYYDQKMQTE